MSTISGPGNSVNNSAETTTNASQGNQPTRYVDKEIQVATRYVDQEIQVGEPWAQILAKEPYTSVSTRDRKFDHILIEIKRGGWSLGRFLERLFANPSQGELSRSRRHAEAVSSFLGGTKGPAGVYQAVRPDTIVELMYANPDSAPKATRNQLGVGVEATVKRDPTQMARHLLSEWAVSKVEGFVDRASAHVSGKDGGFHLSKKETTWEFIHGFSLPKLIQPIELKNAILLRILAAAALPVLKREKFRPSPDNPAPYSTHLLRKIAPGSGGNRKDPIVIIIITFLMLMYARNLQFSVFRKIAGIWLFANNASASIFSVLSRIGLSSSFTTVLKTLKTLSESARVTVRAKARLRAFLLIYDNINRMHRKWDPDLGQHDAMDSGTAATLVEVVNCDVEKAFDPQPLNEARKAGVRSQLTTEVLMDRIEMQELTSVMALHCVTFLIADTPVLTPHQAWINLRLRTTHAKHRIPDGHVTQIHPLATSGHDEGAAQGNRDVLDDLILRQLGMDKKEVDKLLIIVGGDQSTVEKIRTLQRFLDDCPHGYSRYGWALPLIQLWHMGWADLERVLSTHWGRTNSNAEMGDMSSFYFINTILKRKIKDVKRPDYYPTQNFVFDTLRAEIIDCWKVMLSTEDLESYFKTNPIPIEDILNLSKKLVSSYMTVAASERARYGDTSFFVLGEPLSQSLAEDEMDVDLARGDMVLANTILRLRDSMLHYEFQHAISDGDIGRAMNVMAVWTFTFPGCGKNKYANELLEVACNFQYEYSTDLQKATLNNWLCTFTEERGGCFPMDQMQEHNIKLLKKASQRRDASFGDSFYQEIVSYNIRAFVKASETMKAAVGIGKTGGRHKRRKKEAAMKELATAMRERQLHKFRAGRDFGHSASDDFTAGYLKLSGGKVKEFIKRTLANASNIHAEEDAAEDSTSPDRLPLPNIVIDGLLHCVGDEESDESSDSEDE
ncbi:hypothetical protein R3P38DRAFT_2527715 [Favolaschia claudopus]|uniref:DUF6589 domain-containing protein n=1 Tax=Favolaschia claudopus TaxID=2862362 RepID=A0AAW0BJQ1_9AGAR